MSAGKVDVLAVMAKDLERLKSAFASAPTEKQRALISEVHGNLSEARAAVAKLIEATRPVALWMPDCPNRVRLRAALDAVQP